MKDLSFDKKWLPYVYGGLMVLAGILVLIFPSFWVKLCVIAFGLGAIAYGVYIMLPLKDMDSSRFKTMVLIKGIASVVFGLLSVIIPLAVASTAWKAIVYIFAIALILIAALGYYSVTLMSADAPNRKHSILENSLLLLVAIILFLISPESLGKVIIRIIGIAAIVIGLIWIVLTILNKDKEIVVSEADVTVVDDVEAKDDSSDKTSDSSENQ